MIHFKSVPVLNVLVKQNREDADMQDDITFLHEKLNTSLQDLRYILYIMVIKNRYMYMYNKLLWMTLICGRWLWLVYTL